MCFVGDARCVMMRERAGVSDTCDAVSLVCCCERRGREMLGEQFSDTGHVLFCFVFLCIFERSPVLGN